MHLLFATNYCQIEIKMAQVKPAPTTNQNLIMKITSLEILPAKMFVLLLLLSSNFHSFTSYFEHLSSVYNLHCHSHFLLLTPPVLTFRIGFYFYYFPWQWANQLNTKSFSFFVCSFNRLCPLMQT